MAVNTDFRLKKTFGKARKRSDAKERSAPRVNSFTPCPTGLIPLATIPGSKLPSYHHQSLRDENVDSPITKHAPNTARRVYWSKGRIFVQNLASLADSCGRAGASPHHNYGLVGFRPEKSSFVSLAIASGANGCCLKSKQLSMSFAARSRSVNAGKLNRVSISFNGEVKSNWV
jgi:hypothetical protein